MTQYIPNQSEFQILLSDHESGYKKTPYWAMSLKQIVGVQSHKIYSDKEQKSSFFFKQKEMEEHKIT